MSFPLLRTWRRFAVRESPMMMVFFFLPWISVVIEAGSTALASFSAKAGTVRPQQRTMVMRTAIRDRFLDFTLFPSLRAEPGMYCRFLLLFYWIM